MKEKGTIALSKNFHSKDGELFFGPTPVLECESFDAATERELIDLLNSFFDFFTPATNLKKYAPRWLRLDLLDNDKITFYPGTFNPWHQGHFNCLKLCPEKSIVVAPDYSPWKEGGTRSPWSRLREIIEALKDQAVMIYPGFLLLEESNPTYEWMCRVQRSEKNLVIGMDNFCALSRWYQGKELLQLLKKLYVVPRAMTSKDASYTSALDWVRSVAPTLEVVLLPEHDQMETSSTKLRK